MGISESITQNGTSFGISPNQFMIRLLARVNVSDLVRSLKNCAALLVRDLPQLLEPY